MKMGQFCWCTLTNKARVFNEILSGEALKGWMFLSHHEVAMVHLGLHCRCGVSMHEEAEKEVTGNALR